MNSVDIIMCVYNGAEHIEEAIISVINQTFTNWKLLVVDDGSKDGTPSIVERLSLSDSRIVLIQKANTGLADSRNFGISISHAKYIAFFDHDDIWLPNKLKDQYDFLEKNLNIAGVGTLGYRMGPKGKIIGKFSIGPRNIQEAINIRESNDITFLITPSVLIRRSVIIEVGEFNISALSVEDIEYWSRISDKHILISINSYGIIYRIQPSSISSKSSRVQFINTEAVRINIARRRKGMVEIPYGEFLYRISESLNKYEIRELDMRIRAREIYRIGGAMIADRKFLGSLYILWAMIIQPHDIWNKISAQIMEFKK